MRTITLGLLTVLVVMGVATLAETADPELVCNSASTGNAYCDINFNLPALEACTRARCDKTTSSYSTVGNGWCDGVPSAESTASCATLLTAYDIYFACVLRGLAADTSDPSELRVNATRFINTPGYPYVDSPLSVIPREYYRSQVVPRVNSACTNTTALCCTQSPATTWIGDTGKGYNHVLCGTGCITALYIVALTIISAALFMFCGCCWPSPSLKTTMEQYKNEEEAALHAVPSSPENEEDVIDNAAPSGTRLPQPTEQPPAAV